MTEGTTLIATNQGIPSFTLKISNLGIMSNRSFTDLGPTKTDKTILPKGGMEISSCVWMVLIGASYPSCVRR